MSAETDRELLELAAKAEGRRLNGWKYAAGGSFWTHAGLHDASIIRWSPLEDSADALRLMVKLNIHITSSVTHAWASTFSVTAIEPMGEDPYAATRRAIVRAAAEIGKALG